VESLGRLRAADPAVPLPSCRHPGLSEKRSCVRAPTLIRSASADRERPESDAESDVRSSLPNRLEHPLGMRRPRTRVGSLGHRFAAAYQRFPQTGRQYRCRSRAVRLVQSSRSARSPRRSGRRWSRPWSRPAPRPLPPARWPPARPAWAERAQRALNLIRLTRSMCDPTMPCTCSQ
jgi:hypothetical protein